MGSSKFNKRYRVWIRDGGRCWVCQRELEFKDATLDHYIPSSKGGGNEIDNLRTACHECNNARGNAMPDGLPEPVIDATSPNGQHKNAGAARLSRIVSLRPKLTRIATAMALRVDPADLDK